jgi:glyoxylase-like metal-dependent hydrolase (beta-lactamase superfamily II)
MRSRFMILLAIAFVGGVAGAQAPASFNTAPTPGRAEIRLTYLGNAGWEITDGKTYVLTDPFITQFRSNREAKPGQVEPPPMPSLEETFTPDTEGIDAKIHRADYILITHGHPDHALDAPYIAKNRGDDHRERNGCKHCPRLRRAGNAAHYGPWRRGLRFRGIFFEGDS